MSEDRTFDVEVDANSRKFRVIGAQAPYFPAVGPTMGEPGEPASGGELYDLTIFLCRRGKDGRWHERKLCPAVRDALGIDDEIREALDRE